MKLTSEVVRKAHTLTKEIKAEYKEVDYKAQFGICLSYLLKKEIGGNKVVELIGSEKQVKWAKAIKEDMLKTLTYLDNATHISKDKLRVNAYSKIYNAFGKFIEDETDASKLIFMWSYVRIEDDQLREKIDTILDCMLKIENETRKYIYKNMDKETKELLISNKDNLKILKDFAFNKLNKKYTEKAELEMCAYIQKLKEKGLEKIVLKNPIKVDCFINVPTLNISTLKFTLQRATSTKMQTVKDFFEENIKNNIKEII